MRIGGLAVLVAVVSCGSPPPPKEAAIDVAPVGSSATITTLPAERPAASASPSSSTRSSDPLASPEPNTRGEPVKSSVALGPCTGGTPAAGATGATQSDVQRRVAAMRVKMKQCYDAERKVAPPPFEGKLLYSAKFDAGGCLTSLDVARTGLDDAMVACTNAVLNTLQIDPPGTPTSINIPFVFKQP